MNYTEKAFIASVVCTFTGFSGSVFFMSSALPVGFYYLYKMIKEK